MAPLDPPQLLRDDPDVSPVSQAGFLISMLYIFALFSLASEFSVLLFGLKPYVTWFAGPVAILAVIASGNLFRVWRPGPGRWLILFWAWMILASVFGIYRGGSFDIMRQYTTKQLPVLVMLVALTTSLRQVEWFCRIMGFAGLLIVAISLKFGGYLDNRLVIPGTSLENPNDFATHLLIALPFCMLMMLDSKRFSPLRILGIVGIGGLVLTILRSGSRGGLLGLLAVFLVLIWKAGAKQRVAMVMASVVFAVVAAAVFPRVLWDRFQTIFSSDAPAPASETDSFTTAQVAAASTQGRMYELTRSLEYTFKHPLLGLGPGNFMVAEANDAAAAGRRGTWLGTHNSYTQASSEGGFAAFFFFTAALVSSIRINANIYRRTRERAQLRRIANTALCLMVSLIGFAVNILFSHLAFTYYLPMLAGVTVAFAPIAEREIRSAG